MLNITVERDPEPRQTDTKMFLSGQKTKKFDRRSSGREEHLWHLRDNFSLFPFPFSPVLPRTCFMEYIFFSYKH